VRSAPRRFRLVLAYDGTDYAGWQIQPDVATVQATLEAALGRIQGDVPVRVRGAGRTDAGVHAVAQVADFEIATGLDDAGLVHALSRMLPDDVRPVAGETVAHGFHSRNHARWKTYRYVLDRSPDGDPFLSRFALHVSPAPDLDRVRDALDRLPGRRDWSGFAGAACPPGDRTRTLTEATLEEGPGSTVALRFTADGFLNHMVRNLVGTILEVGRGRFDPGRIDDVLTTGDRTRAGPTAAARGLFLWRVRYDDFVTPDGVGSTIVAAPGSTVRRGRGEER
jgi:tRNA pseudouridine38-40 synthase